MQSRLYGLFTLSPTRRETKVPSDMHFVFRLSIQLVLYIVVCYPAREPETAFNLHHLTVSVVIADP